MEYLYVPDMPYGKVRRKLIKDWFEKNQDGAYAVNCKYRPQVKHDPDLKKLIKTGYLKTVREPRGGNCNRTLLVRA